MSDRGHSPLGASQASRWFACPGSVDLLKLSPEPPKNVHGARGTMAHTILEECFDTDKDPWEYEGRAYEGGVVTEEDICAVEQAIEELDKTVDYVTKHHGGVKIMKEVGFDLSNIHPDLWGTSDIVIYTEDFSFLGVYDYKHGSKLINAEENLQLMYYALGAINFLGRRKVPTFGWGNVFKNVELGIIQPRVIRKKGSTRLWEPSAKRLDDFAIELKENALRTVGSTEYSAGSHCYWCNAKALCPQIFNKKLEQAKKDFS